MIRCGPVSAASRSRGSVEHFEQLLRRARDPRALPANDDGALHEFGVLEEQIRHRLGCLVVLRIQLQGLEVLVLPDQICRGAGEQLEETLDISAREGVLQVFDDVELDAALAQDVQRAARLPSAGVVVDEYFVHLASLRDRSG